MNRSTLALAVLSLISAASLPVIMSGCATNKATIAQPMAIPSGDFVVESIIGFSPSKPVPDAARPTLTFDTTNPAVKVSGSTGVNRISSTATFSPNNGGVSFTPFISTRRAGPENIMAQENAVNAALSKAQGYTLSNDLLTLTDGTPQGKLIILRRVGK